MTTIAVNAMILQQGRLSGIGHYIVQLTTWFANLGADWGVRRIIILCRSEAEHHFSSLDKVEVMSLTIGGGRIARVLAEQVRLPRLLVQERVDALLNPAFTGPTRGAPIIVTTVHDVYFRVVPDLLPRAQRWFLSASVPYCCRRSSHVVTPSSSTMRDLARFYPDLADKISVVPLANRLPAPAILPMASRDHGVPPFVLFVAAVTGNKNPESLIAGMAIVRQRYPEVVLTHVGHDLDGRLAAAVKRHSAADWAKSRTDVPDAELQVLYGQCLCFAIPSLYEGFGLPLLEAQAFGAPVVASDRGALPEVGGNGALYADPADPMDIAAAITRLIEMPEKREALRRAGFANQARFSWERTARGVLDLLVDGRIDLSSAMESS